MAEKCLIIATIINIKIYIVDLNIGSKIDITSALENAINYKYS